MGKTWLNYTVEFHNIEKRTKKYYALLDGDIPSVSHVEINGEKYKVSNFDRMREKVKCVLSKAGKYKVVEVWHYHELSKSCDCHKKWSFTAVSEGIDLKISYGKEVKKFLKDREVNVS